MQLLNIVLALVPLVAVSEAACHQSSEASVLSGSYGQGQKKTGSTTLSEYGCYYYLNREITGCYKGGRRAYDNWEFSADPNAGAC
ncbi:hypothetical protein BFJ70_g4038 [Fusarium oxysporum]|nr:hypothetical protein FOWG_10656 [Fusarium oxysporum f. sp. lycopersici MN25]KAJ4113830.1 hypothetical protein NW765_011437 [Fusarium oxysporum]KAJ4278845.1 hypothetical protein NW764_006203 [Fusarium oxysporum]RKL43723.1 hypothetical protein BFJ70_g4038 [Fusarium oxysporum]